MRGREQYTPLTLLYRRLFLLVLLIALVFLGQGVWGVYQKERETKENRIIAERRLSELEGREYALRKELDRVTSRRGIEEELRRRHDVAKEGEHLLIIVDRIEEVISEEEPPWRRLFSWWPF